MAKFTRKHVEAEAGQYLPGQKLPKGANFLPGKPLPDGTIGYDRAFIMTAAGQRIILRPGDWVVCDPDGAGHTSFTPSAFAAEFQPAAAAGT